MNLLATLGLLQMEEQNLGEALRLLSARHPLDSEVHELAPLLASWSDAHRQQLAPFLEQSRKNPASHALPAPPRPALLQADRPGGQSDLQSLVLDLQNVVRLATHVQSLWIITAMAAQAHSDRKLDALAETACADTERQLAWCRTQIRLLAPQLPSASSPRNAVHHSASAALPSTR